MKDIHWVTNHVTKQGNAYGYHTHNTCLREAAEKVIRFNPNSKNLMYITSPEYFKDRPKDRKVFLFTMFEGITIPDQYLEPISQADHLLAPSEWVADLFKKYFSEDMISVVNHGVSEDFKYKRREFPTDRPFRFLWLGAHNPRKGWEEVIHAWKAMGLDSNPAVELYMKTTTSNKVDKVGNIIFDSRNFSKKTLVNLYHTSHCFLFPSRGEGFGLTLAEAMRTGLPCIATDYSGQKDFFDASVGYPIGYKIGPGKMKFLGTGEEAATEIAFPDVNQMAEAMVEVFQNYSKALKRGKKAFERIKKFTWKRSAFKLNRIIQEYGLC